MSKLYYVSSETISQAERMREKLNFLSDSEFWKIQFQGQDGYPKLTDEEVENCFKNSCQYSKRSEIISDALNSIVGFNQAEWEKIQILKIAALERDLLDDEIGAKF